VEAKQDNLDQIYERIVAGKGTTEDWRGMYNSPPPTSDVERARLFRTQPVTRQGTSPAKYKRHLQVIGLNGCLADLLNKPPTSAFQQAVETKDLNEILTELYGLWPQVALANQESRLVGKWEMAVKEALEFLRYSFTIRKCFYETTRRKRTVANHWFIGPYQQTDHCPAHAVAAIKAAVRKSPSHQQKKQQSRKP
jgi:hypothetical protein